MTKEITKACILQQLQDKFKLRELIPEKFAFSELVVPVYNVEPHLTKAEVESATKVVSATSTIEFHRVPDTEKWRLHRYTVVFVTGTYTTSGVLIGRTNLSDYIYLDLVAGISTSYTYNLPQDVVMNPRDAIYILVDGYTATGNLTLILDVTKEEVR